MRRYAAEEMRACIATTLPFYRTVDVALDTWFRAYGENLSD